MKCPELAPGHRRPIPSWKLQGKFALCGLGGVCGSSAATVIFAMKEEGLAGGWERSEFPRDRPSLTLIWVEEVDKVYACW